MKETVRNKKIKKIATIEEDIVTLTLVKRQF